MKTHFYFCYILLCKESRLFISILSTLHDLQAFLNIKLVSVHVCIFRHTPFLQYNVYLQNADDLILRGSI